MSDGDHATPDPRDAPDANDTNGANGANPWLTRSSRPSMGAAPWERGPTYGSHPTQSHQRQPAPEHQQDPAHDPQRAPADRRDTRAVNRTGTGPVTVADLIAKVGAKPARPASHHVDSEPQPRHAAPEHIDEPGAEPDPFDAVTDPHLGAAATDLADLSSRTRRVDWSDRPTTVLPPAEVAFADPPGPQRPNQRPPKLKANWKGRSAVLAGRSVAAIVAVLALTMTGGAYQWQSAKNHRLNHVSALDPESHDIVNPSAQYGDENFLIVGVDTRAGANSQVGAGTQQDAAGVRSDTVMLVSIPANRKRVVVVSFPRDLAITPMKCE
ncbi:MAG: LytR family transcriptional regulator, partial [Mycobacteriaceae bacterium]|nr:LytR family transcriptional regulator [Mycobacteriaceae bacterium]